MDRPYLKMDSISEIYVFSYSYYILQPYVEGSFDYVIAWHSKNGLSALKWEIYSGTIQKKPGINIFNLFFTTCMRRLNKIDDFMV